MTENTAASDQPRPEGDPRDSIDWTQPQSWEQPRYGVRSSADVPPWHPEANAQQRAAAVPPQPAPGEDVLRGALFALVVLPLGIIVWMLLWEVHVIASIVPFGVAAGAARLYVVGTRGRLSRTGVWVIVGITVATAILAFVGGVWLDAVDFLGGSPLARIFDPEPWSLMADNLASNPDFVKGYSGDLLASLAFGALGCFFTLRRLFAATRDH